MSRVLWTDPAVEDLEVISEYISRDSEPYAHAVVERILSAIEQLETFPRSGRVVPEANDDTICEIVAQNYRVIHRVKADAVEIVAVLHGARDLAGMEPKPWDVAQ